MIPKPICLIFMAFFGGLALFSAVGTVATIFGHYWLHAAGYFAVLVVSMDRFYDATYELRRSTL
jgi:hypothetical protein